MSQHKPCLILNSNHMPLGIIGWQRAYCLYFQNNNNINVLSFYENDHIVGTNGKNLPVPAVMKTRQFFNIYQYSVRFSRKNLFLRDNYTCQYCNTKYEIAKLTYDHVIPKSKWNNNSGHPTCWTNIVTACTVCNRRKGDKTPQQANMTLHTKPYAPKKTTKYLPIQHHLLTIKESLPAEWSLYLTESYA